VQRFPTGFLESLTKGISVNIYEILTILSTLTTLLVAILIIFVLGRISSENRRALRLYRELNEKAFDLKMKDKAHAAPGLDTRAIDRFITSNERMLEGISAFLDKDFTSARYRDDQLLNILAKLTEVQSKIAADLASLSSVLPLTQGVNMDSALFVSGVSAVLQAIQTWLQFRDSKRASSEFQSRYRTSLADPEIVQQANVLDSIVPAEVMQTMLARARKCWKRYSEVLEGNFLPSEVDDATEAVKQCICRELKRIKDLNGVIPDGDLRKAADKFCHL
jgi:hypothetical protein